MRERFEQNSTPDILFSVFSEMANCYKPQQKCIEKTFPYLCFVSYNENISKFIEILTVLKNGKHSNKKCL